MSLKSLDSAGEKHGSQRKFTESSEELYREVDLWIDGMAPQGYELDKSPAPNTVLIKVFIWRYVLSTRGRLQPDGRPTVTTTLTCATRFFRGFATATGSAIAAKDRSESTGSV
ncbi:hypothetical protein N7507_010579 [Penicillium longicatenatum]|nr:hypothetical protein N7507_010579 [Penicillium longicatenatum]